jgi:Heterokaryon incompatibility protein (HET)
MYNGPFLTIELIRGLEGRFAKLLRPVLERWHFRKPMLLYVYEKFDSQEKAIRLIKLRRRYPGCDISCSLERYSLTESPPYEAISYTWGNSVKDHLVFFDGRWLPTTRNVHSILHDLSSYSRARWIWIDAVCINQNDLEEKNPQVEMMGEIYHTAERVVVWLDDRKLTHYEITEAMSLLELINFNSVDPAGSFTIASRPIGSRSHWRSLNRLLSHPY